MFGLCLSGFGLAGGVVSVPLVSIVATAVTVVSVTGLITKVIIRDRKKEMYN